MLVNNKEIIKQFSEGGKNDSGDDQDPFKVSDADTMLNYLKEAK
jgi:peroxiredoxin